MTQELEDDKEGKKMIYLVQNELVVLLDEVQQEDGVILDEGILVVDLLVDFVDPTTNDIGSITIEIEATQDGSTADRRVLVDDGLLDVSLNLLEHVAIQDSGEDTDGIASEHICVAVEVLQQCGDDNNDFFSRGLFSDILEEQIGHTTEVEILALEQLCSGEENIRDLVSGELLVVVDHQVEELGEEDDALVWLLSDDRGIIEQTALLDDSGNSQVVVGRGL